MSVTLASVWPLHSFIVVIRCRGVTGSQRENDVGGDYSRSSISTTSDWRAAAAHVLRSTLGATCGGSAGVDVRFHCAQGCCSFRL